jgi:hypothetical protein
MYGETGNRIMGLKSTELYDGSAHTIRNFYITELGTLIFGKQFEKKSMPFENQKAILIVDTEFEFYIIITETKIHTVKKDDLSLLFSYTHGILNITEKTQNKLFDNILAIQDKFFSIAEDGDIGTNNFSEIIKYPIKDQRPVVFDLYKVMKVGTENRLALLKTYEDTEIITDENGIISLKNTDVVINRIYQLYKGVPLLEDFDTLVEKKVIAILRDYQSNTDEGNYLLGNEVATFTGDTADVKYGTNYFTGITPISSEGKLMFGKAINFFDDIVSMAVFQNRLVIATHDTVYYSKTFDYNNFVNGVSTDDAFYIKPSVINNNQPTILKLDSSLGLWVTTNRGIYSIGHNVGMSPTTSVASVKIATDIPATENTIIIDDILYFIDTEGILRSCQAIYNNGALTFLKSVVEKYDTKNRIKRISKGFINDEISLICSTNDNVILVYKNIDGNMFRKIELEAKYEGLLFGFHNRLINEEFFFDKTEKNYEKGFLKLNPPLLSGKNGGIALNDYQSRVKKIVVNMLNENNSLKKMIIAGSETNNLGTENDTFSLYSINESFPPLDGYTIEIITNETEDSLELRMISVLIDVHSDQ